MESNKVCQWLLYYSKHNVDPINSGDVFDVESTFVFKQRLCSSISYFDCGHTLFSDFPNHSTGFLGIFDYLVNDKSNVMDKMKADEQQTYINHLIDCENFSVRHHATIIKCIMKKFACQLAPWEIINRALQAMGVSSTADNSSNVATFRHMQRSLVIWLKECALRGLRVLLKSNKIVSDTKILQIIDHSTTGSLIIYALMYYASAKMTKYTIRLPDFNLYLSNEPSKIDLAFDHSRMVLLAFADICDHKDILPLEIDCLISRATDTVPSTLTIALIFHWTFGNSLKHLENCMKMSSSSTNSDKSDINPSHQPSCHPFLGTSNDVPEEKAFFISNNSESSERLRQLFLIKKDVHDTTYGSGNLYAGGDSFSTTCQIPLFKALSYELTDNSTIPIQNDYSAECVPLSLKNEFQKKLQQKQNIFKQDTMSISAPSNETTWLAQSRKNEVIHIPLTPKKHVKSTEVVFQNDQNLTKSQMNQIQMQLSFRRKKIENDKKRLAEHNGKFIENSKQIAFFQAVTKGTKMVRPKSLESVKQSSNNNACAADKRMSMFVQKTEDCSCIYLQESSISKGSSAELVAKDSVELDGKNSLDSSRNSRKTVESPEIGISSIVVSPVQITDIVEEVAIFSKDLSNVMDDIISVSRKNSSPSISSLSSCSNTSLDNNVIKDDYQKSLELITTSLTSLKEELRALNQQQFNRTHDTFQISGKGSLIIASSVSDRKMDSENNSVAETPTNNGFSLTEISELQKCPLKTYSCTNNERIHDILPVIGTLPEDCSAQGNVVGEVQIDQHTLNSPDSVINMGDLNCQSYEIEGKTFVDQEEPCNIVERHSFLAHSFTNSMKEDCCINMASSLDSAVVTNVQPVAFVIADNQIGSEAIRKQEELLAIREQRRIYKLEMFRQRREQDRESKQGSSNEVQLERELKKTQEKEKIDSKKEETSGYGSLGRRSSATSITTVTSGKMPQTPKTIPRSAKRDSAENLSVVGAKKNGWFSSMRDSHRLTSSSTSKLNTNLSSFEGTKLGVPIPPQDYAGPRLFGKRKVKTNRSVISNAISYCCLAGSVNVLLKDSVLKDLSESDGTHFMILFRDSRCQYRSLYIFDLITEDLRLITGNGPKRVTHEMVEKFYKYNSGAKQFNQILSTKHLSTTVDAICIQSVHWNMRPTGQLLSGAVSTSSISQTKTKRLL